MSTRPKEDAPALLRKELAAAKWQPKVVSLSGVTDPYQPIERRLQLTRRCLEVFAEFRNPVGVVTKNHLVCRDIDLLSELAQHQAAAAFLSITTLDAELAHRMEPRATQPAGRLAAIKELTQAGVPVGVLVAPVIPGLNGHAAGENDLGLLRFREREVLDGRINSAWKCRPRRVSRTRPGARPRRAAGNWKERL